MAAKLLIDIPSVSWAYTFLLDPEREYSFGVSRSCTFHLTEGADRQALLGHDGSCWVLKQCHPETLPATVNGEQVIQHRLRDGDVVRIGRCEAVYQNASDADGAAEWMKTRRLVEQKEAELEKSLTGAVELSADPDDFETLRVGMQPRVGSEPRPDCVPTPLPDTDRRWAISQLSQILLKVLEAPRTRDEIYRVMLEELRKAIQADNGFLMIPDRASSRWTIRAWIGDSSGWSDYERTHPLPLTVTNRAYRSRLVVSNALSGTNAEISINSSSMVTLQVNGYIALPLLRELQCNAVLYFDTRTQERRFRPADVNLLELAGSYIMDIESGLPAEPG